MKKASNDFDSFLNECQTYVWEWYIPEQKVRFGIPSLNSLWLDDPDKNIKLATMLERVHPDDIQKVLVRHTSPLYRSDKMFEVDLRLNVASELLPDGQASSGSYEWYGFRGKTVRRDKQGRPTYVRGVAINIDHRFRIQQKLLAQKDAQLRTERQKTSYCSGAMQEVNAFIRHLAHNANAVLADTGMMSGEERLARLSELREQVSRILDITDRFGQVMGDQKADAMRQLKPVSLWEHLAELQQRLSLQLPATLRLYFSNLYDECRMWVNPELLDSLLQSVIHNMASLGGGPKLTFRYDVRQSDVEPEVADTESSTVVFSVVATLPPASASSLPTGSELSFSVCRLMAKRMWGEVILLPEQEGRRECRIVLPLDPREPTLSDEGSLDAPSTLLSSLGEEEEAFPSNEEGRGDASQADFRPTAPQVLLGLSNADALYQHQHLFDVHQATTTDRVWQMFSEIMPDIIFVQEPLAGTLTVEELVCRIHQADPTTPIVVCADYANRTLHHEVHRWGARYLLANPLTLRKVNVMVKKFLK